MPARWPDLARPGRVREGRRAALAPGRGGASMLIALFAACAADGGSRCEVGDAPVTLRGTEVRDQFVRLDLAYSGGCEAHAFAVWWSGVVGASDPPQVPLTLQHDDRGDRCEALVERSIWVDLSPLHEILLGTDQFLVRFDGLPGSIDYTVAALAPPPSGGVLAIEQGCDGR